MQTWSKTAARPTPAASPGLHEYSPVFDPARFLENAERWAAALRGADAEVVMTQRPGTHGDALWRAEFPLMLEWAFDR